MPTMLVQLPGDITRPAAHQKVSLNGLHGPVVFHIADPEVEFANLADDWQETHRPAGRPILERVGGRLRTIRLRAIFGTTTTIHPDGRPGTVNGPVQRLILNAADTVTLAYSSMESSGFVTRTGEWVITDLRFVSIRRRQGDNAISRAVVDIEFTESSPVSSVKAVTGPTSPTADVAVASSGPTPTNPNPAAPRRHTVARGETLWAIAQRYYGNGNRWREIAAANGIIDPRRDVRVGMILTIP